MGLSSLCFGLSKPFRAVFLARHFPTPVPIWEFHDRLGAPLGGGVAVVNGFNSWKRASAVRGNFTATIHRHVPEEPILER
jgi:hypothetical protein